MNNRQFPAIRCQSKQIFVALLLLSGCAQLDHQQAQLPTTGVVDIELDVAKDGAVSNVVVGSSKPANVFHEQALEFAQHMKFDASGEASRRAFELTFTSDPLDSNPIRPSYKLLGLVLLKLTIGPNGNVESAEIVRSYPKGRFDNVALQYVKRYKFEKGNGTFETQQEIVFKLE